jgi:hypothetical protein
MDCKKYRKRIIPTEQPSLVGEVSADFYGSTVVAWSVQRFPTVVNLGFLVRSIYYSFQWPFVYPYGAEWTPFHTRNFSENLVAP